MLERSIAYLKCSDFYDGLFVSNREDIVFKNLCARDECPMRTCIRHQKNQMGGKAE